MGGSRSPDSQLSLADLLSMLWLRKWLVLVLTLAAGGAMAVVASRLPKQYEAKIVVSPVIAQGDGSAGLGSTLRQLGGLASLAGLSTGAGGGSRAETIATLQSGALTELYIRQENLLPVLFPDRWDAASGAWKVSGGAAPPTTWDGNEYFARKVRVLAENSKTGLVTLGITWTDPAQAASWANGLVRLTNEYLRSKVIAESERNVAYLTDAARQTTVIELRNAISQLMEAEIRKQMLARGSDEYALKVIDPAVAPEKPAGPGVMKWLAAGLAGGLLLSVVITLLLGSRRPAVP